MLICGHRSGLSAYLRLLRRLNKTIGFVPTMGALHEGHLSLIGASQKKFDITVVSIFVNPRQFNKKEDFEKYPSDYVGDVKALLFSGADVLFLPTSAEEVYFTGGNISTPLAHLPLVWEGNFRPGHFKGVSEVIFELLSLIKPDAIFLGKKDYEQCVVIKEVIAYHQFKTHPVLCDTVRNSQGLALSSRNKRLSKEGLEKAIALFQSMKLCIDKINERLRPDEISKLASSFLLKAGFEKVEYVGITEADSLAVPENYLQGQRLVILVAGILEGVRLIDNLETTVRP